MKKRLSAELLASLKPKRERYEVFDSQLSGFGVRVSTNGRLVFFVHKRYRDAQGNAGVHKEVLGDLGSLSLVDARMKALEVLNRLTSQSAGVETPDAGPTSSIRSTVSNLEVKPLHTVVAIFDLWVTERGISARTKRETDYLRKRLYEWGWAELDANAITRSMVVDKFKDITAHRGPTAANNDLGYLGAAYEYARIRYRSDGSDTSDIERNPVSVLSELRLWNKKKRRQTRIQPWQLSDFFRGVQCELNKDYSSNAQLASYRQRQKYRSVAYILTSLFLGTRKGETGKILAADLCEPSKTLIFRHTKNGTDHHVPIGPYLWAILMKLKVWAQEEGSAYLFPSKLGAQPHMTEPRGTLAQICSTAGIKVSQHDLRRTFASVLDRMNISTYTLKRLMNHIYDPSRDSDVSSGYIHVDIEELRPVLEDFEQRVLQLAGIKTDTIEQARRASQNGHSWKKLKTPKDAPKENL